MRKIFAIMLLAALMQSCMTMSGTYTLAAYDRNGLRLNSGLDLLAEGPGIYSMRNALCETYPGSTVRIQDVKTGKDLAGESPYKCAGHSPEEGFVFVPPPEVRHLNNKPYRLAYKKVLSDGAFYEYTADNEPIEKWSSLITLLYYKGVNVTPEEFVNLAKNQKEEPVETQVLAGHAYVLNVFPPSDKYHYFETSFKKTFHISQCQGVVVYKFSKKYPVGTSMDTIMADNRSLFGKMVKDSWVPSCSTEHEN